MAYGFPGCRFCVYIDAMVLTEETQTSRREARQRPPRARETASTTARQTPEAPSGARASDRAYQTLRSEIVRWQLQPGTVLAEVEQSARLGVSRTPVREALSRLAADGLVAPAGRGMVVTDVSLDSVAGLFELRQALETHAARLAAMRRDREVFDDLLRRFQAVPELLEADDARQAYYELVADLDRAVDEAVANPYLVSALASARLHLARVRRLAAASPQRLLDAAAEHALIVEAIGDGDPDLAAHATHVHLHRALTDSLRRIAAASWRDGEPPHNDTDHQATAIERTPQ